MKQPIDYFSNESLHVDLAGKTARGGIITGGAQFLRVLVGLASTSILARLLLPEDFGLVMMVAFFTSFATMFVDSGLSMATVQSERISRQQASNLFWIGTALGATITLIVACSSPLVSWFYGEPRLTAITIAMSCSYFLSGLTIQHKALLKRTMQFHRIAMVDLLALVCGQLAGIAWAWYYYQQENDYFALVCIPIATEATRLVFIWLACRWRPSLPRLASGTRSLVAFGANLTGYNFVNYFSRNLDNLLLGKVWGEVQLGLYDRAYRLFLTPIRQINTPVTSIAVPALSRLKTDPERYRRCYLKIAERLTILTVPSSCFMALMAPEVVAVLLGENWEEAGIILRALAIAGMVQSVSNTGGWLFVSQGRAKEMFRWSMIAAPLFMLAFLVGLPWQAKGVAIAYAATSALVTFPLHVRYVCRRGPVTARDIYGLLPLPLTISAINTAVILIAKTLLPDFSALVTLVIATTLAFVTSLTCLFAFQSGRTLIQETLATVAKRARGT